MISVKFGVYITGFVSCGSCTKLTCKCNMFFSQAKTHLENIHVNVHRTPYKELSECSRWEFNPRMCCGQRFNKQTFKVCLFVVVVFFMVITSS